MEGGAGVEIQAMLGSSRGWTAGTPTWRLGMTLDEEGRMRSKIAMLWAVCQSRRFDGIRRKTGLGFSLLSS